MHPREPLTRKARAAISKYAAVKCERLPVHMLMVDAVLEAERMPRARLYEWLQNKGYYSDREPFSNLEYGGAPV